MQQEAGTNCLACLLSWKVTLVEKSVKLDTPQQDSWAITWSQDRERREGGPWWVSGLCTWYREREEVAREDRPL